MTTTTTKNNVEKQIKIVLSEGRPVNVNPKSWPVIASADWFNGEHECQANYVRRIKVRKHADGRCIVYGFYTSGNGGVPAGFRGAQAGFLLPSDDEELVTRAIRRVAGVIGDDSLGDDCIADLPARELV